MMYPLVRELAADGFPVAVTCRVLKIARQPYYRWLANPITDAELEAAHLANALFDAHRDDPEFGYRYLADEARDAGHAACDRTMWRVCSANGWWSAFGKKRGKNGKPGPPVHDDLVGRDFTADAKPVSDRITTSVKKFRDAMNGVTGGNNGRAPKPGADSTSKKGNADSTSKKDK